MEKFLLLFIGGGTGTIARFLISSWMLERFGPGFPLGTLAVNVLGCFLVGLVAGLPTGGAILPINIRLLFIIGFVGGLTTFSAYEYESFMLMTTGLYWKALLNILVSVILGFLAVGLGYTLVRFNS